MSVHYVCNLKEKKKMTPRLGIIYPTRCNSIFNGFLYKC